MNKSVLTRVNVLGCPMDIGTMKDTVSVIADRVENKIFTQHVAVNVAKVVNMEKDPVLSESVKTCDIINIDGMGLVFGGRLLGYDIVERVAGVDLFHHLLEMSSEKGFPVFLLGATDQIVSATHEKVQLLYPNLIVAGHHHGYFWDDEKAVVNKIKDSGARLLFVAITSPKKENFINKWKNDLGVDFVMGVGGTFDVVAGKVKRAPLWMQDSGLEWLYRVVQEPRRMWKRYFFTNVKYFWMLVISIIKMNK